MKIEITEPTLRGIEEYRRVSEREHDDIGSLVNEIVRMWLITGGWCDFETMWPKSEDFEGE